MAVFAQKDTLRAEFPPVKVEAKKPESSSAVYFSSFTSINREQIKTIGGNQVSDVLNFMPGLFVKDYGGAGGLKTLSIRGSNSAQTLIMLDGMKLNSSQNGSIDLSVLPMSFLEDMEISRGGISAVYGGSAMGGMVNLRTSFIKENSLSGNFGYGSYNQVNTSVNGSFSLEKNLFSLGAEWLSSKDNYPYQPLEGSESLLRNNADFRNLTFNFSGLLPSELFDFKFLEIYRSTERGIPNPAIIKDTSESKARLKETELILITNISRKMNKSSNISLGSIVKGGVLTYSDSSSNISSLIYSGFSSFDGSINLKYNLALNNLLIESGLETNYSMLKGDNLDSAVGNKVIRRNFAAFTRLEAGYSLFDSISTTFEAGLRYDIYSDVGAALSPLVGIIAALPHLPISFRTNYSYNFRPPSFNELYYLNYGTKNLKPERSSCFNFGLTWQPWQFLSCNADAFYSLTNNQIVSVPKSPVIWSAQNVGQVLSRGAEIYINISNLINNLNLTVSYLRQYVTDNTSGSLTYGKQIPYLPQETFSSTINYKIVDAYTGINAQYVSFRYYLPDNTNNAILPSYFLLNFYLGYKLNIISTNFDLRADCRNLFNEQYSIIRSYPMPGRSFNMSLSFNI